MGHNNSPLRGRPPIGIQAKDSIVKTRMDAYTLRRVERTCRILNISKAELFRQGVLLYLDQMEKTYPEIRY